MRVLKRYAFYLLYFIETLSSQPSSHSSDKSHHTYRHIATTIYHLSYDHNNLPLPSPYGYSSRGTAASLGQKGHPSITCTSLVPADARQNRHVGGIMVWPVTSSCFIYLMRHALQLRCWQQIDKTTVDVDNSDTSSSQHIGQMKLVGYVHVHLATSLLPLLRSLR